MRFQRRTESASISFDQDLIGGQEDGGGGGGGSLKKVVMECEKFENMAQGPVVEEAKSVAESLFVFVLS